MTKVAIEQLTNQKDRAFLLILGAGGAGKSSLAQAGIVPGLTVRGVVSGAGLWRRAVLHSGNPGGPFAALAEALCEKDAIPELLSSTQDIADLSKHLRASADDPAFLIVRALDQIEAAARGRNELVQTESVHLAIVVDQLEELFTTSEITSEDRKAFTRCLDGLAKSGRVLLIGTMRSDYWHRAAETPLLVEMAAGDRRLDLLPPTQDEVIEMIRQPAEAAGLEFETDPGDIGLDATLAKEASIEPGALPLFSFLLDELYKIDIGSTGRSVLTYSSMQTLGGLKGAIATRAETVSSTWPAEVQEALPKVLRTLVTVSREDGTPTARAAPMSRFPQGTAARKIVDALLDKSLRLLVAEGDGDAARVRFSHEALITHWKRARDHIATDRANVELRSRLEHAAALWRASKDDNRLLGEGTPLVEAEQLLARHPDELGADVTEFVQASRLKWAARPAVVLVERDLRLDFFMGLALWIIFLSNVQSSIPNSVDFNKYFLTDAKEAFVFISGYTLASVYYPVISDHGLVTAFKLVLERAKQAYVAYIILFIFYATSILYLAQRFGGPDWIVDMGMAPLIDDNATETMRQALLLNSSRHT